ncbi:MAG: hypothetical protein COA99_16130 [Moraxellaceae bacterium]|nr:MAG: hypothetical protein COA99_16130 [Moraxellaceae bacterium]
MGKLTNMVAKESSFSNRVKYNAGRMRLAGIGLLSKLDQEREHLYQQIVEKGNGSGTGGVVSTINTLGTGVVSLAREESQRIFDELVAAGEALSQAEAPSSAVKKDTPVVLKAVSVKPITKKITKKPVAKKPAVKSIAEELAEKAATTKPTEKASVRMKKEELVAEDVMLAFGDAKQRIKTLDNMPSQAAQLALYALYKQSEDGDVKGRRPAMTKLEERTKFDARRELKGMSKTDAIGQYVAKVNELAEIS